AGEGGGGQDEAEASEQGEAEQVGTSRQVANHRGGLLGRGERREGDVLLCRRLGVEGKYGLAEMSGGGIPLKYRGGRLPQFPYRAVAPIRHHDCVIDHRNHVGNVRQAGENVDRIGCPERGSPCRTARDFFWPWMSPR